MTDGDTRTPDRRGTLGTMNREELAEHYAKGSNCRLATADERVRQYVMPVRFEFDAADGGS